MKTGIKVIDAMTKKPISVIPMGVNLKLFSSSSVAAATAIRRKFAVRNKMLLFVGRLAEKKGVTYLISAMKGIAKDYGLLEGSVLALAAGADVVLVCEQYDEQEALLHHLDKSIVDGVLDKVQIEASLARIARVKQIHNS